MEGTLLLIFTTSLAAGYTGALMPGPLLTITVSESARRGFWAGPKLVAGHGIAEVLVILALSFGLSQFLQHGTVKGTIAIVGGVVLAWMGLDLVRGVWRSQVSLELEPAFTKPASNRQMLTGALVSVSNPYWIIWWATGGAALVTWAVSAGTSGLIAFYAGHILSDLTWYGAIAAVVTGGGRFLTKTAYRAILGVCGLFLLSLGAYFVYTGVGFWMA